jgi:hypothetical protein
MTEVAMLSATSLGQFLLQCLSHNVRLISFEPESTDCDDYVVLALQVERVLNHISGGRNADWIFDEFFHKGLTVMYNDAKGTVSFLKEGVAELDLEVYRRSSYGEMSPPVSW